MRAVFARVNIAAPTTYERTNISIVHIGPNTSRTIILPTASYEARSYRSDMRDMRDTYRDTFRPDARFCPEVDFRRAIYREITPVYGVTKTICIAR